MARHHVARKAAQFTESVIREMTRLAARHGAINLSQGYPDFAADARLKEAAVRAIRGDVNQYAITWGAPELRGALSRKYAKYQGMAVDPDKHVTVTCGATEAMISALSAVIDPGDEVVIFEPFYENYGPDAILSGATPRFVRLRPPDWSFDERELSRAFNRRTKAIVINTPNNPTGKVFTRDELQAIAGLCRKWDTLAVTDEVYEHILYEGTHISMATLPGMAERTITTSSLSKTFCITGWRLGYCISPERLSGAIRKVHDFLTVGAPHPLQVAAAHLMDHPDGLFENLPREYLERRELFYPVLEETGFCPVRKPAGAYYVMCDISRFGFRTDVAFARWLVEKGGVASVPGSSFYRDPRDGRDQVRFAFCKKLETLKAAAEKLRRLPRPRAGKRG
ncbi:MAG TPA: aminotransferase class I/II-fold pyridoxal phosphate-dependent enzyme [Planctomycetota bacterium]|nr:aminotransferase class I/II-fold pyridoxal phosphate-dependent enzyme [Planctomycetota bacterium]